MINISDFSTRELLKALNLIRQRSPYYQTDADPEYVMLSKMVSGGVNEKIYVIREELIAELATREHVPGRTQSKKLRQLMAKHRCSREEAFARFGRQLV